MVSKLLLMVFVNIFFLQELCKSLQVLNSAIFVWLIEKFHRQKIGIARFIAIETISKQRFKQIFIWEMRSISFLDIWDRSPYFCFNLIYCSWRTKQNIFSQLEITDESIHKRNARNLLKRKDYFTIIASYDSFYSLTVNLTRKRNKLDKKCPRSMSKSLFVEKKINE